MIVQKNKRIELSAKNQFYFQLFLFYRGNFKSPQKILKFIVAILKRNVFRGYLFNSHAQTTALISSTLIFLQGGLRRPLASPAPGTTRCGVTLARECQRLGGVRLFFGGMFDCSFHFFME